MNEAKNPNEDPSKMTNTQRIAMGLAPLGSPASKSPTQRIAPDSKQFATKRMAKGDTKRDEQPLAQSWALNPTGAYKPGNTQRLMGPQIAEKKHLNKFQLGLILTVPTLVVVIASIFIFGAGNAEEVIDRNPSKFKDMIKNQGGSGGGSTDTNAPASGNTASAPTPPQLEVMKDGTVFRKEKYTTANIRVELPLHHVDNDAPMPEDAEGFGGRALEPIVEDKTGVHNPRK